jgi:choice-of-anchor C domain-containing protein
VKFRRTTFLLALSTALVALTASPASAAPVFANGFEDPALGVEFHGYVAGQQFGGWTVTAGSVDLTTDWQNAEGRQSLDLNGSGPGAVARSFPTQLLTTYKVTFAVAGNSEGPPTVKSGRVTVNDQQVDAFTFDVTGKSNGNMGWTYRSFYFTNLLHSSATLKFAGTSLQAWGAVVDDVKVDSCLLILCPASASQVNRIR